MVHARAPKPNQTVVRQGSASSVEGRKRSRALANYLLCTVAAGLMPSGERLVPATGAVVDTWFDLVFRGMVLTPKKNMPKQQVT